MLGCLTVTSLCVRVCGCVVGSPSSHTSTSQLLVTFRRGCSPVTCIHLSSSGSVDLTYSDVLYKDLSKGLEGLLLNSYLHLVYLVTPYDMISQCKPDWMVYFRQVQSERWTP